MSENRRKMNKQSTGTVPKVKCRNNTTTTNEGDSSRTWPSNNLAADLSRLNLTDSLRNSRRNISNHHSNYCTLETMNGSVTPSSSTSRRNSSGTVPKCDNVTKCPDKKQIEDKLSQIREYLQITTSLMSSMKNTDDQSVDADEKNNLQQMINDLTDSEEKLVGILATYDENVDVENVPQASNGFVNDNYSEAGTSSTRNDFDEKIEQSNHDMEMLRDQQQTLLSLQQKAENKIRDAKKIRKKLLLAQYGTDVNNTSTQREKNLGSFQDIDVMIKELDDRSKRSLNASSSTNQLQDKLLAEVDNLHSEIINLHNVNEDRNKLIQVLDNRDMELRAQHVELQTKLSELQSRKQQVDQLVDQLQNMDGEAAENDDDDVGVQVRRICTMKDQLSKLKDMLEIVKTTETVIQNSNESSNQEEQDLACEICTKAENFLKDTTEKQSTPDRYDSNMVGGGETHRRKQINTNAGGGGGSQGERQCSGGAKPRAVNKLALQAELEAKKRELEDIMGKHKAGTSNLNHDVGSIDNKSEFSCSSNAFFDPSSGHQVWPPPPSQNNRFDSSERYSSDDCGDEENGYSDLSLHNQSFSLLPTINYPQQQQRIVKDKRRGDHQQHHGDYVHIQEPLDRISMPRTPERNLRSNSMTSSSNTERVKNSPSTQSQLRKQLELIRSVCDSMLDQQQQQQQQQQISGGNNVQQLRNNLTPSPLYSEPRHFQSPNPMNAIVNPIVDSSSWNNATGHMDPNYQGWMTTNNNNLQTQAFMLNTLNQCCQMLWIQQRELMNLRQAVNQIQERVDTNNGAYGDSHLASPHVLNEQRNQHNYRQKMNQQVPAACSMPNLNQYNVIDPTTICQHQPNNLTTTNATSSGRLLDPNCLNNVNDNNHGHPLPQQQHHPHIINNNSVLHGVNAANINHQQPPMPGQIWNGQAALNNQVAPGNRANNYWDNFRSYSRQNLLSTKSNEGFNLSSSTSAIDQQQQHHQQQQQQQHPQPNHQRNHSLDRTNPFSLLSTPKSNSTMSCENTPRRCSSSSATAIQQQQQRLRNAEQRSGSATLAVPPPDVLNVNVSKGSNDVEILNRNVNSGGGSDGQFNFGFNDTEPNHSNLSEEHHNTITYKDCENTAAAAAIRINEWHEEQAEERVSKSKLFEELRENVYKEVVSLISANETRPHFLIQLFRDLQMISSDPLRLKILQSIQAIITHSIVAANQSTINRQQVVEPLQQAQANEQILTEPGFSLQSTVWSKLPKSSPAISLNSSFHLDNDVVDVHSAIKEILPFLNDNEDEVMSHQFLMTLKQMLVESEIFQETVRDSVFKKHFANVLDDLLFQFVGKKVRDVKMHVIQTINDLIKGELSFIQLIQDTCPDNCENDIGGVFDQHNQQQIVAEANAGSSGVQNIENGDLAEADQGRGGVEDDDDDDDDENEEDEEGAVGGFWDMQLEPPVVNSDDIVDLAITVDFQNNAESQQTQFIKQGLDQVPTRLPTKSRSNTPSKDRSSSSRSEHSDQF